jgi:hypothetical protein
VVRSYRTLDVKSDRRENAPNERLGLVNQRSEPLKMGKCFFGGQSPEASKSYLSSIRCEQGGPKEGARPGYRRRTATKITAILDGFEQIFGCSFAHQLSSPPWPTVARGWYELPPLQSYSFRVF